MALLSAKHLDVYFAGVKFGGDGFVEVLAATQTPKDKEWFQGTADAVRQYNWMFDDVKNRIVQDIVILSGDRPSSCIDTYVCGGFHNVAAVVAHMPIVQHEGHVVSR